MAGIRIEGMEETFRALKHLEGFAARDTMQFILNTEAGIPLQNEVRITAPRLTGQLQNAIVMREGTGSLPAVIVAVDFKKIKPRPGGFDKRANRYPYIVEHGSKRHVIRPKMADRRLKFGGKYRRFVTHPGFSGRFFFRKAVNRSRPIIKRNLEEAFRRRIEALVVAGGWNQQRAA